MPVQRLIDPSDPEAMLRVLQRLGKVEQKLSKVSGQTVRTKKALANLTPNSGVGATNLRFTFTSATTFSWANGWIQDGKGKKHQIAAGSSSSFVDIGATPGYIIYNADHGTLTGFDGSKNITTVLSNPNTLIVCLIVSTGVYPITRPIAAGLTFQLGTNISQL